jgi:hypothetical protein
VFDGAESLGELGGVLLREVSFRVSEQVNGAEKTDFQTLRFTRPYLVKQLKSFFLPSR